MATEEREERFGRTRWWTTPWSGRTETGEKICTSGRSQRTSSTTTPRRTCASGRTRPRRGLLLNYLISQAAIPEYPVRFRWKPNSVALWDNVSQHYAVSDYWPAPRRMERATIKGDRPF
jgi:taurine dioxygenase